MYPFEIDYYILMSIITTKHNNIILNLCITKLIQIRLLLILIFHYTS